jgi:hypothetical protein
MPAKKTERTPVKRPAQRRADEARRAYEYLGRVEIIEGALVGSPFVAVTALENLAQQQLSCGNARNAANLLEAAEHLCFAALAPNSVDDALISRDLKQSIATEFNALIRSAEERWRDRDELANRDAITRLYSETVAEAQRAFSRGGFRPALELARGADALSQVGEGLPASIPQPGLTGRLAS